MTTDTERLDAYANWIRANANKKGSPEFEKVAEAYRSMRLATPAESMRGARMQDRAIEGRLGAMDRELTGAIADIDRRTAETTGERAAGFGVSALQGLTFNLGDEIGGGLAAVGSYATSFDAAKAGQAYSDARDAIRGAEESYITRHPVEAIGANLAGGLVTGYASAPRALLAGSRTMPARMVGAVGTGAAYGGIAGFGAGEDGLSGRLSGAAAGAGAGVVLGPVAEMGATQLNRLVNVWRSRPVPMLDRQGNPTAAAVNLAREAGVDLASVNPDLLKRMTMVTGPGQANMFAAETLPVPVPLTRGQATDDIGQLARENALTRGTDGGTAMGVMRDFRGRQESAIEANIAAFRERLAGGSPVVERGQGGPVISGRVNELNAQAAAKAKALYANARALDEAGAPARVPFAPVDDSAGQMAAPVEGYVPEMAAAVRFGRQGDEGTLPGIIHEIQKLGGIKLTDRQGNITSEGGDIRDIFSGRYPPGLVNNQSGKSLDYIREALGEQGWFPGRDPQDVSIADVLDLIGGRARNPMNSGRTAAKENAARDRIRSDMEGAGITRRMPEDQAAGRLAIAADARARGVSDPVFGAPEAPSSSVQFAPEGGFDIVQRMAERVRSGHAPENVGKVWAQIEGVGRTLKDGPISPRQLFETRSRLTGIRSGGGEDAVAAGKAISAMDEAIADAVEKSLLAGDEEAIAAFKAANAHYRDFAKTFKQRDLVGLLVRRDYQRNGELKVDPIEATNAIFGTSNLGFVNKRDITRDLVKLRDTVGTDSDAWAAVRQEAFNRIAGQSIGKSGPNGYAINGGALARGWDDANTKNPEVMRVLFSAEERRDIGNFVNVARRATTVDSAVYAPSMSPFAARRLLEAAAKRIPTLGPYLAEGIRGTQGAIAARAATSGRLQGTGIMRSGGREIPAILGAGAAATN